MSHANQRIDLHTPHTHTHTHTAELHAPYSGEVRLTEVSSGLLELYSTGRWGAVCSEDGFGETHAHSVCRQLGYTEASSQR